MAYSLYRNSAYAFIDIIEGLLPREIIPYGHEGLPIPEHLIPKRVIVLADRPMPNLWAYEGSWVVSAKARALMRELVPDSISYVPITVDGPPAMKLEPEYYFMNVLIRDQLIDYERSKLRRKRAPSKDGRFFTSVESQPGGRGILFKPHLKYHIWHEISFTVDDEYFSFITSAVLLSDALWGELNTAFPDEIDPDNLSEPMTYDTSR